MSARIKPLTLALAAALVLSFASAAAQAQAPSKMKVCADQWNELKAKNQTGARPTGTSPRSACRVTLQPRPRRTRPRRRPPPPLPPRPLRAPRRNPPRLAQAPPRLPAKKTTRKPARRRKTSPSATPRGRTTRRRTTSPAPRPGTSSWRAACPDRDLPNQLDHHPREASPGMMILATTVRTTVLRPGIKAETPLSMIPWQDTAQTGWSGTAPPQRWDESRRNRAPCHRHRRHIAASMQSRSAGRTRPSTSNLSQRGDDIAIGLEICVEVDGDTPSAPNPSSIGGASACGTLTGLVGIG